MTSHVYNSRNNPLSAIKEGVSSEANFEASGTSVISETEYGQRENNEINGILGSVSDQSLQKY